MSNCKKNLIFLVLFVPLIGCSIQAKRSVEPIKSQSIEVENGTLLGGNRNPEPLQPDLYPEGAKAASEPIIRYGRYNLASASPTTEQQDLMSQIITTNVPTNINNPNVKDAMNYVMMRSGYMLCPITTSKDIRILYTRPLPAAHYKLGPITLRNALQVLAGPAFKVQIDEVNRIVCFSVRDDYQLAQPPSHKAIQPLKTTQVKNNNEGDKAK